MGVQSGWMRGLKNIAVNLWVTQLYTEAMGKAVRLTRIFGLVLIF